MTCCLELGDSKAVLVAQANLWQREKKHGSIERIDCLRRARRFTCFCLKLWWGDLIVLPEGRVSGDGGGSVNATPGEDTGAPTLIMDSHLEPVMDRVGQRFIDHTVPC